MIDVNEIMSVYSGRPGCCCGCKGKHTYRTEKYIASKHRGYPVHDEECSNRTVKLIVNKMNKNPNTKREKTYYHLDLPNRWYIAYILPKDSKK